MELQKKINIDKLGLIVTVGCNSQCKHCLCADSVIPNLTENEFPLISNALVKLGIRNVQITGGEPTLVVPIIEKLSKFLESSLPDVQFEMVTNGSFAESFESCCKILSSLKRLRRIYVSFDPFHAEVIPIENIKCLVNYCSRNNIGISGFAAISSPQDLSEIFEYEKLLSIKFNFQKTLPIGNALKYSTYYHHTYFEPEALSCRCPQLSSIVYIPSYGFTQCCSSLFHKNSENVRRKIARKDITTYIESSFCKMLNRHTMGDLLDISGLDRKSLPPECSLACELCNFVMPTIIEEINYD